MGLWGANGGSAGVDVCIVERTGRKVSVTGINDHELPGLDIVTCVALIQTNHGKVNMGMYNMLLQLKSAQMGNNLAGKQVNNNNKVKTKQ